MSTANMKKTSKVYSYEDQKWDLEVQQELLRKKSAEFAEAGRFNVRELLKKAKLSQKQKVGVVIVCVTVCVRFLPSLAIDRDTASR